MEEKKRVFLRGPYQKVISGKYLTDNSSLQFSSVNEFTSLLFMSGSPSLKA
jgi:hypothetical protein